MSEIDELQRQWAEDDLLEDQMVAETAGCLGRVTGTLALGVAAVAAFEGKWGAVAIATIGGGLLTLILSIPDSTQRMHEAKNYGLPPGQR